MERKYFGTDGIRGKVGEYPITPEFMMHLGWAAGRVLAGEKGGKVLVGKDTRISGYLFESAMEAGLSAAGIDVHLLGPMPTPAIAYLTRTFHARAGIVISASHNPFEDNGIKFFSAKGTKLPDEIELAIENELEKPMNIVDSARLGKAERVEDARGRYIEFCKSTIDNSVSLNGLKIEVDCANGATYYVAPSVLKELGAQVVKIATSPDGLNINTECGSTKPKALQAAVREHQAHLGIAFDGDGDRVIMVDDQGEVVDGDELLFLIAMAQKEHNPRQPGVFTGGVVGTLMSNLGMELALKTEGIPFTRAKVGDRYVMELLLANGWTLGGESSGHIICLEKNTTGDGIVAALQVLSYMVQSGRSLRELRQRMQKFPQHMINVRLKQKQDVLKIPEVSSAVATVEKRLADRGRVLLRPSGTEPVVRVMVEGEDHQLVVETADYLASVVAKVVA